MVCFCSFDHTINLNIHHPFNTAVVYRSIQILACIANEIQQKVFVSTVVIAATIMTSICTTTVVKLPWTSGNIMPLLMFSIVGVNCVLAIVTSVGGMASVYTESVKVTRKLQKSIGIIGGGGYRTFVNVNRVCMGRWLEIKWKQRFYRSCVPIKIRFGSINFVDRLTPLACLDLANGVTLQLLLLGK